MESISEFLQYLNPKIIINTLLSEGGIFVYVGLFAIIFAETGLAIGFFLPGDSLLVVAGVIAAADHRLNIFLLLGVLFSASVLGDTLGYFIGSQMGNRLFNNPNSWIFRPSHVEKAQKFFAEYGAKTVIVARFLPIIRSFVPPVAGAAKMPYRKFLPYSLLGSFLWIFSMVLAGYFLASLVERVVQQVFGLPNFKLEDNIEKVVVVVVILSATPIVIETIRARMRKRKEAEAESAKV